MTCIAIWSALKPAARLRSRGLARWLGDIAPHLLPPQTRDLLVAAKDKAVRRRAAERRLTKSMLYIKGWPRMLTDGEADLLAEVRREVSPRLDLRARYLDRTAIHTCYAELLELHASRGGGITDISASRRLLVP
ncbi:MULTISPECIES: hypothetical protein [unclassified Rhizobium]|uniref:hypothetical protein n=1 Tax=unclassified Rhizobium TaxID=2613769 RepID=UPI000701B508|nr:MULTISPECIES: hypothetical protein [unclassified Rhizobium]KQV33402.1 hypothetical protein ASC86_17735 [Rhizobium sp. Root1212]KRD22535.1 hypothetical protein ASE37_17650 [Rhizobium sp. Root268]